MKERIRLLCRTLRQGSSAVTAIVTGCRGATPRSPGALLVLTAETALGTVGGGQAEHDIIGPAMEMLRGGAPVQQGWHQCLSAQELRHMGQEFGGEEEILLLRWEPRELPLAEALLSAMGQNADCSLHLEYDKVHWRGTLLPIAEAHTAPGCFTLKLQEGGRCYVFGGGHVSQALVPLLSGVDFCCVVLDERPDYATPALFPTAEARCGPLPALAAAIPFTTGDSVIIMTRGHQGDYEVLCEALRSPVWYIGMVGSHRKMEATFRWLREDGFTDADLSRIVTPIGLAIDAETPAEIAVSITAQLIQRRLRRSALRAPLPLSPTIQGGTHHDQDHPRFPLYPLWCLRQSLQPRCDQNGAERGGKAYPQGFLLFLPVLPRLPLGLPRHPAGRSLILL